MSLPVGRRFKPNARRGLLQGEVAGGPGIRMTQTEQEIDVGGPWTDAMQCGERGMGFVSFHAGKRLEIDRTLAMAALIALRVLIFGLESPSRASLAARACRIASW